LGEKLAVVDVSRIGNFEDVTFSWFIDGIEEEFNRDPEMSFYESGEHSIQLVVTAGECFSSSIEKKITILDCLKDKQDSTHIYNNVTAYPNPTTGDLIVNIVQAVEESDLFIYDSSGSLV